MYYEDCCSLFPAHLPDTLEKRQVFIYWFLAMAQFIHLSLLLAATIQLPLVSVTRIQLREGTSVTIKFPQGCRVEKCCRGDECGTRGSWISSHTSIKVNKCDLSSTSLRFNDSGNYTCHHNSGNHILNLNLIVTRGWINDHLDGFDSESQPQTQTQTETPDECRKLCTEKSTCEYFTFKKGGKRCFLIPSESWVMIQKKKNFVSGYPDRGVCNENNDAVSLQFHQQNKSWFEALKHCRDEHFSLVQITNSTMQQKVKSLLQNKGSSIQAGVWIGLERSMFAIDPITWKWISGSEVSETDEWNSSFPVDSLNNHCGKIIRVTKTDFKWLDAWCHDELPFICQDAA